MSLRCRAMVLATAAFFWIRPAGAIVGGAEDHGPLSRATVMVLSSKGGVCSAVIVARDAVLTAGHCVSGAPEHRVHFRASDGQPVLIEPSAKAVHPGYDAKAVEARRRSIDLAIVRLPEPLPARFDVATLSAAPARAGAMLHVGGYGVAREGDHRSTGTFRIARIPAVEPHGPSRILVWAAAPQGEAGLCVGDSGGPIARDNSSGVFAIAAWASGSRSAKCGGTSQGILLGPQRAWIDATLAAWGSQARWE